ncbi:aminopeptidase P family protein [Piscirickettsia litoralis]|uniref:Xaa-Pro aminopeptidase n=1 Tax=Piscirickettsia litoralis TaxID=1891921 RepID=A0ABX3A3K6_9GAMM|nr:aminopeptidase P family protein [Piscirickettsia litoralis]ODN43224.1 Xaa-Pro aminopeptidase [Piscirickettsia litoralis]
MFAAATYSHRRQQLQAELKSGIALILGNPPSPMNYQDNTLPFRQDSSFLYYFGLDRSKIAGFIDCDSGESVLIGDEYTVDTMVWIGRQPTLQSLAEKIDCSRVMSWKTFAEFIHQANSQGRKTHYLAQYRAENILLLQDLFKISASEVKENVSLGFTKTVIKQRLYKSVEEVAEVKKALTVTRKMHLTAMRESKAGRTEQEVMALIQAEAVSVGMQLAYPIIFSKQGEVLHNEYYGNTFSDGDLVLHDSGASAKDSFYASDITRTFPVSGKFTHQQKEIYELVLKMQSTAFELLKPGVSYKDVHLAAARCGAQGLIDLGLMQGDVGEIVEKGAHALFFPHGLGHNIGLDVHDMEGLGENLVGYSHEVKRSEQFGLAYLRLGNPLEENLLITVEPGLYFIPLLIKQWKEKNKFAEYINYNALDNYMNFGGVRIEDNILITNTGYDNLSANVPKEVADVEAACIR